MKGRPVDNNLKKRNKRIFQEYCKDKNMAKLGRKYGLTRERIRQIIAKMAV